MKFVPSQKIVPLQLAFLIFSMLLNCMGIVILKFSGGNIPYGGLGLLEAFKDLPIAIVSLFSVNLINRTGMKNALIYALVLVAISCIALPFFGEFWFFKIWFAIVGIGFAVAKISVFGILRNNVEEEKFFARVMNRIEASFMIGIFCVNIGFGWLLSSKYADYWKFGFWLIAVLAIINIFLLIRNEYKEVKSAPANEILANIGTLFNRRTVWFFVIIFLIVFTEQSFNSWLPTFYKTHLKVDSFLALQASAFLALFSFVGRVVTSKYILRFSWLKYVLFCLFSIITLLVISRFFISDVFHFLPALLVIFPAIGLFLSPLYPLYNSKMLLGFEKEKVSLLVSIIVIFSSLGSSVGSLSMSFVFQNGWSNNYALFALIPVIFILCITIFFFKDIVSKKGNSYI